MVDVQTLEDINLIITDGNKRTAEVSMFVNFKSLGYELKIKDTVLGKLTLDIANHRVSEEDANKIIRSYLNF